MIQLRVKNISHETKDTITIALEAVDGASVEYQAGQFLTLIFKNQENELRRSYSFSSAPGIDPLMTITVKRVENGQISRHLLNHLHADDILTSLKPSGRFTIQTNAQQERQFFFIAAGSGITPVYSLIKKIITEEPLSHIVLINQNRDEKNIIFKKQLEEIEKKFPNKFKLINLLTHPLKYPRAGNRMTNSLLEKLVNEYLLSGMQHTFYLCGPSALMRMAQFTLRLMGFADEQIRKENFTVEFMPPPPLIQEVEPRKLIIHHQQKTRELSIIYPKNILQAALDNHIEIPYSCRGGRCSTCVAKLIRGKVVMSINEVLTEKEINEGLVLTCVGYAATDVEIEF